MESSEKVNEQGEKFDVIYEQDGSFRQLKVTNDGMGVEMSVIHPDSRFGGKDKTVLEFLFSKNGLAIGEGGGTALIRVAEMLGDDKDRPLDPDMVEELLIQKYGKKFLDLTSYKDFGDLLDQVFPDIRERQLRPMSPTE